MRSTTLRRAWLLAFLFACLTAPSVFSQNHRTGGTRPKVALVLSGGAALGVSHIGVLKALEELRIPIDAVTGTSMGAIVGGLYASGLSPSELDEWFRKADWHFLLSDSLPRESESFRNKERQFDVNQGITFGVAEKGELKLPAGLIVGRNVIAALRELTVPARHITNFDDLPIQFRAVATDMETGEMVVLKDGDLVEAVRASMSVPGVFTPQWIQGRFLVDGGSTNNLPIDVAQQLAPDVVIVVDASPPLKKASELDTAPAIANQVIAILLKRQMADQIAKLDANDVHLRIKIENLGVTEFEKAASSIDTGYQQAMEQRALLSSLSVSPREFQDYLARQRSPRSCPITVTHLEIKTPEGEFAHRLPRSVEFDVKDRDRFKKLQTMINDLGEMQEFEVGDYEVVGPEDDYGLLIKARKKKTGPNALNVGFELDYSSTDESNFSFLLSYRMTELNALGAEWATYLSLGNRTRIFTEWYQPISRERRFFAAPYGLFENDFIDGRDENHDPLRFRMQTHLAGLDVGTRLWQAGEFRIGYARGSGRISRRLGVDEDVPSDVDLGLMHADLTVDTLNAANFATKGTYGRVSFLASREELGASDNYNRIEGQFFHPMTIGKNTVVPRISAALGVGGGDVPLYDQLPLGGFLQLSGLPRGALYGENAALAEVVFYRKIADMKPGIGRGIYAGFSLEAGEIWKRDFDLGELTFAGSLFLGADTVVGPVYLGLGMSEDREAAVYLQLGPLFRQGRHQR